MSLFACGLDVACYAQSALDGLVTWLLSLVSLNTLVLIWVGTAIGAKFGWPALVFETLGIFLLMKRSGSADPVENVEGQDAASPFRPKVKKPRKPVSNPNGNQPGTWNKAEGRWNE